MSPLELRLMRHTGISGALLEITCAGVRERRVRGERERGERERGEREREAREREAREREARERGNREKTGYKPFTLHTH